MRRIQLTAVSPVFELRQGHHIVDLLHEKGLCASRQLLHSHSMLVFYMFTHYLLDYIMRTTRGRKDSLQEKGDLEFCGKL